MTELEQLLGAAGREEPREDRKPRKRSSGRGRPDRCAPTAVIEGDSHQTFFVEGDLTIVIGGKDNVAS